MLPTILFLALAQPPAPAVVELPAPPAAKWVELKAAAVPYYLGAADKKPMKWVAVDENCWVEPQDGGKAAALYAVAAGTYRLIAIPEAGDPVKVRVTVGDAPAPPPKPPLPPAPPADPLAQRLLAAYQTDPGTPEVKAATKAKLADVYREAAKLADNGRFATCGDLLDVIHEAAKSISDDLLRETRTCVGRELQQVLPANTDDPLDTAHRKATVALFERLAAALDAIK
jgi:hypothetical protein